MIDEHGPDAIHAGVFLVAVRGDLVRRSTDRVDWTRSREGRHQLNDTHPPGHPELMRILLDDGISLGRSMAITQRTFGYTEPYTARRQWRNGPSRGLRHAAAAPRDHLGINRRLPIPSGARVPVEEV